MNSEVATHFNLKGHNFEQNLKAVIFASKLTDALIRKNVEAELIHLFLIFGERIINQKIYSNLNYFFTNI
jgi:hypothetical protein